MEYTIQELGQWSSHSVLDPRDQRIENLRDYGPSRKGKRARGPTPEPPMEGRTRDHLDVLELEENQFLDLLLFCSALVLWMSGLVMFAFGFYLVLSQYGWAVLTGSTMYWVGMLLQTSSAFFVIIAAIVVTTLITPDTGSPKRTLLGFMFLIITALLLISEIVVCSLSKENQKRKAEDLFISLNSLNKTLNEKNLEQVRRMGYECESWENDGCKKLHRKHPERYINFLIGSSSITLAIIILVIPVLFLVYRTTVRKISRVQPTLQHSELFPEDE